MSSQLRRKYTDRGSLHNGDESDSDEERKDPPAKTVARTGRAVKKVNYTEVDEEGNPIVPDEWDWRGDPRDCLVAYNPIDEVLPPVPDRLRPFQYKAKVMQAYNEFRRKVPLFKDLPSDLPVIWNTRLKSTGGQCIVREGEGAVRIELSPSVIDTLYTFYQVLAHEMCHACYPQDDHGKLFRLAADSVEQAFPGIFITTEHRYRVKYEFYYTCRFCGEVRPSHFRRDLAKFQCQNPVCVAKAKEKCESSTLVATDRPPSLRPGAIKTAIPQSNGCRHGKEDIESLTRQLAKM